MYSYTRTAPEERAVIVTPVLISEVSINGHSYYFLIDTGSSVSLIDLSVAARSGLTLVPMSPPVTVLSYGGEMQINTLVDVSGEILLRDHPLYGPLYAHNMGRLLGDLSTKAGVPVVGIIGCKDLTNIGLTIDFKRNVIKL